MTMAPYYQDDMATIYLGDCAGVMPTIADGSIDLVVTSPPYNMGLQPGGGGRGMYRPAASRKSGRFRAGYDGTNDDAMPYEDYCLWQRAVLAECWRIVRLGIFYNHRPRVEHGKLRMPLNFDFGDLTARQIIIWDRKTGIDVNLRNFCTRQEWIILFTKDEFRLVSHSASGMGDIWHLGMETKKRGHPAPFPVTLPTRCIEASGATSVLDPLMGVGTTLRAAKDLGIRSIGIEKNEAFCETAAKRLNEEP